MNHPTGANFMSNDIEAERKLFEEWVNTALDGFTQRDDDAEYGPGYLDIEVHNCWIAWNSRAALAAPQQEPKAWVRLRDGKIDWAEDCLYSHPSDHDGYEGDEDVTCAPVFIGTPPTASLNDEVIERLALKHIAPLFATLGIGGDYKQTTQFQRIKSLLLEAIQGIQS